MTITTRFSFEEPRISHLVVDQDNEYVWIAFTQDSDGICHLKKVSATDFDQVYFDIEIEVDQIIDVKLDSDNGYIYVLYRQPNTYVMTSYSLTNPLTDYTNYSKPYGIPTPLEMTISAGTAYVLLADSSGGYGARILVFNSSGVYTETVLLDDLLQSAETIYEVSSITSDADDNLWIVTYTNPVKLVRVWFASGGWNMQQTSIS